MALSTQLPSVRSRRAQEYDREGFWIEPGLLPVGEVTQITEAFMELHRKGGAPGYYEPHPEGLSDGFHHDFTKGDPLAAFPRVMHPHRFMSIAMKYLLDSRIMDVLEELVGEEVLAAQSMFYYKPPRARGQASHQDNFYLSVKPGTCVAAWMAMDRCDEENGALRIVRKTHRMDVVCPTRSADPGSSFTKELVTVEQILQARGVSHGKDCVPTEGLDVAEPVMEPGDVLFFNGSVVHGSGPNRSETRFRRSFVNHYVGTSCAELAKHYHPLLDRQGREVGRGVSESGGVCGTEHDQPH